MTTTVWPKMVGITAEWIQSRTGIITRHIAEQNETVADLATAAARHDLPAANIDIMLVDLIIVATITASDRTPNTAGRVGHARWGLHRPLGGGHHVRRVSRLGETGQGRAAGLGNLGFGSPVLQCGLHDGVQRFHPFPEQHPRGGNIFSCCSDQIQLTHCSFLSGA